ncbi:hypothetical protein K469DRAFT_693126 [Zopfia rhizophila CBS 207.26]|uniref:Uncharacterized protein n=1 Tax=Zopfia rhizophila CBS 207.26 TaxID=1314779 RepID=A0A6A6EQU0_9PEZI|nr:hypothetical protein K469DRAFT_693126 [Zopfia rhizophila CBS 207.26]
MRFVVRDLNGSRMFWPSTSGQRTRIELFVISWVHLVGWASSLAHYGDFVVGVGPDSLRLSQNMCLRTIATFDGPPNLLELLLYGRTNYALDKVAIAESHHGQNLKGSCPLNAVPPWALKFHVRAKLSYLLKAPLKIVGRKAASRLELPIPGPGSRDFFIQSLLSK